MQKSLIAKGSNCIVIRGEDDITWAPLLPAIVTHLNDLNCSILILDVSDFSFPQLKPPPSWVIKKYNLQSSNEQTDLVVQPFQIEKIESGFKNSRNDLPEHITLRLRGSVASMLVTLFADSKPNRHRILNPLLMKTAFAKASELFTRTLIKLENQSNSIVLVPNGRFPYQKATELAAREAGLEVLYYERGFIPSNGFYLGRHPTQDRVAWQERARELSPTKAKNEAFTKSTSWLRQRKDPYSTANEYAGSWSKRGAADPINDSGSMFEVTFFTSSQDEFEELEGWEGFGWRDQYEAFGEFAKSVSGPKALRVHPNFVNKSFGHARDEMRRILWLLNSDKSIMVVWPEDKVNSYRLISRSKRVFVYGSTVGLEASADQKSVWNSMNSIYDEFADVRKFEPGITYDSMFFEPWQVDGSKSLGIIEAMIEADVPFRDGVKMPLWNSSTIPLIVRLLNLIRIGSIPYFLLLLGRSVSIRANRTMISITKVKFRLQRVLSAKFD